MGLLGDFLEAFYGAGATFQTVRATVHSERRQTSGGESSRRRPIRKRKTSSIDSSPVTVESKFWAVLPDRVRVDVTGVRSGKPETTVEVVRGNERFKRVSDGSVEYEKLTSRKMRADGSHPTEFRRHFDRGLIREFFASLVLEDAGPCTVAGRDCVRINAKPVPGDRIWPHWLASEADEYLFAADLAVPSLLSIVALLSGAVIDRLEVVDLAFDVEIDRSLFVCQPLEGNSMRDARPITQRVSLEAAAEMVPFKLLVPKRGIPEGFSHVHYEPSRSNKTGESVSVFCIGEGRHSLWFHLRGSRDEDSEERLEWEAVEVAGRHFEISDPEVEEGMMCLRFCQDGTWVEIVSDHPRQDLLDIAMSFEPFEG